MIASDNFYLLLYVFACVYFPESVCMSSLRQWSRTMVRSSGLQNFTRVVIGTAVNYLFLCEYEKNAKVCILGVVFKFIHCTMCGLYSTLALWYFGYSRKNTFSWENNIFEAIFPMFF